MNSLQFWKQWSRPYQILFWILSIFGLAAIGLFWIGYFSSPAPAIVYDHFQQVQSLEVPSRSFSVGLINLTVPADSYLIFEYIFGSALRPNVFASYFFLSMLSIAFVVFVSITTILSRFRFLIAMGIAILFMVSLRLDSLQVFGFTNRTPTIALILIYAALAFYFHAIRTYTSFVSRMVVFSLLTALVGFIISFFAKIPSPLLHLSVNGLVAGIILCALFILMVSHEIVAAFVSIVTQNIKSTRSLLHFLILTAVYLVNVFLMFASKMGIIEWSFFSVSPFALITISTIIGVWGFRQREPLQETIVNEEPLRIYFFISIALISFGAMTYFISSSSDMMIDELEDLIIAAHFGCGLIFVLYVIANFAPMLNKNLAVHKILYKPETMPYFTFRLMAVIATFAVMSWAVSWRTYLNQATATYYDAQGDLNLVIGEEAAAEASYLRSLQFRNQNQHAHYALASIYSNRSESIKERREYDKAIEWTPSVAIYLNLARAYSQRGDLLQAALTLDEGRKKFPQSAELQNAIGLSFLRLKQTDSAFYFFQLANKQKGTGQIPETNLLGAYGRFNTDLAVDSLISLSDAGNNGITANKLAIANLHQQKIIGEGKFSPDTTLNVYKAMTLCNYLINQKETADTLLIRNAIQLSRKEVNQPFSEQLLIASAYALYAHGQVKDALQIVRETAFASNNPDYFSLMGLWLLEQDNAVLASSYLKAATEKSRPHALYHQAIAETEADSLNWAIISWDSLSKSADKNSASFAEKMKKVLTSKANQTVSFSDDEKYLYCRYRIPLTDKTNFMKVAGEIVDERLRVQAIIDRSKKWMMMDEPKEAADLVNKLDRVYSSNLNQQIISLKMMLAVSNEDWAFIQKNVSATGLTVNQRIYFEAMMAIQNGNRNVAQQKFTYLAKANNQDEDAILAAVRFLSSDSANPMKSFSVLVDGLLAKPNSVKILKQHALMAATLGFENEAQDSLNKLRKLMIDASFKKFIAANPDYFGAVKN